MWKLTTFENSNYYRSQKEKKDISISLLTFKSSIYISQGQSYNQVNRRRISKEPSWEAVLDGENKDMDISEYLTLYEKYLRNLEYTNSHGEEKRFQNY